MINLTNLAVRPLQLAYYPTRVLVLAPVGDEAIDEESRTVVVDHGDPGGRITVVPNPGVSERSQTFVMSGFLLDGLLNESREE